jgi:hypothetical protein
MPLAARAFEAAAVPPPCKEYRMRHADRPYGPGKPLRERTDAVTAAEESDELAADLDPELPLPADAGETARHADRNAHANRDKSDGDNSSGGT